MLCCCKHCSSPLSSLMKSKSKLWLRLRCKLACCRCCQRMSKQNKTYQKSVILKIKRVLFLKPKECYLNKNYFGLSKPDSPPTWVDKDRRIWATHLLLSNLSSFTITLARHPKRFYLVFFELGQFNWIDFTIHISHLQMSNDYISDWLYQFQHQFADVKQQILVLKTSKYRT